MLTAIKTQQHDVHAYFPKPFELKPLLESVRLALSSDRDAIKTSAPCAPESESDQHAQNITAGINGTIAFHADGVSFIDKFGPTNRPPSPQSRGGVQANYRSPKFYMR